MGPQLHGPLPVAKIKRKNGFKMRKQGKYNRVFRAHPIRREYKWREDRTPSGRRVFEPIP